MEQNILLLSLITLVCYFIVGNPYTYAIMSKITTLKVKDRKQHMILVGIHAVVMTLLMYGAYLFLIKDKVCPKPKKCATVKPSPPQPKPPPPPPTPTPQSNPPQPKPPQPTPLPNPPSQPSNGSGGIEGFSF